MGKAAAWLAGLNHSPVLRCCEHLAQAQTFAGISSIITGRQAGIQLLFMLPASFGNIAQTWRCKEISEWQPILPVPVHAGSACSMNRKIFHRLCFQLIQEKQNFGNSPASHQLNCVIFYISGYKSLVYRSPIDSHIKNSVNSFSDYQDIKKQLQHTTLISISSQWGSGNSISCLVLWNPSLCLYP